MRWYEVLVIGSGPAALRAGLAAQAAGREVAVFANLAPDRDWALLDGEGLPAPLGNHRMAEGDSAEAFAQWLCAGGHLPPHDPARRRVQRLADEAVGAVIELEHWGLPYSRDGAGLLLQLPWEHAGPPRHALAGDRSGFQAQMTLARRAVSSGLRVVPDQVLLEFVLHEGRCVGAVFLDRYSGERVAVAAGAVVLAGQDAAALWSGSGRHWSGACCELLAARKAGCDLRGLDLPRWGLAVDDAVGAPVSPMLLAAGAGVELDGERLPDSAKSVWWEDRLPRVPGGAAKLRLLHPEQAGEVALAEVSWSEFAGLRDAGVDPHSRWELPVRPRVAGVRGGVVTDEHAYTEVPGLFAAGDSSEALPPECRSLPGVSLLAGLVFGRIAGEQAAALSLDWDREAALLAAKRALRNHQEREAARTSPDGTVAPPTLLRRLREVWTETHCQGSLAGNHALLAEELTRLRQECAELRPASGARTYHLDRELSLELRAALELLGE